MKATGSSGVPGASISPPCSTRMGQYEKRSVRSPGPTMSPGRTMSVLFSPKVAFASISPRTFRSP